MSPSTHTNHMAGTTRSDVINTSYGIRIAYALLTDIYLNETAASR